MKIYFAGSIRGGRDNQEFYFSIIKELGKFGSVITEHIGEKEIGNVGEDHFSDQYIFERDVSWIKEADVVVAEVTTPSLGVGYELGLAQSLNKDVVCLFRNIDDKKLSAMVAGNSYMKVFNYQTIEDVADVFSKVFKKS